jgi:septal ring factor EnvC (AmiA/AmiB activator)
LAATPQRLFGKPTNSSRDVAVDWDLKTLVASGTAIVMAIATGVEHVRTMSLDDTLGVVSKARETAEGALKNTQSSLEANAKRQDAAIVDLQAQVSQAKDDLNKAEAERDTLKGRLEAAQANTLRMADLAEKICSRTPRQH